MHTWQRSENVYLDSSPDLPNPPPSAPLITVLAAWAGLVYFQATCVGTRQRIAWASAVGRVSRLSFWPDASATRADVVFGTHKV